MVEKSNKHIHHWITYTLEQIAIIDTTVPVLEYVIQWFTHIHKFLY